MSEQRPSEDRPDYGLADEASNARLDAVVQRVRVGIEAGEVNRREALVRLSDGVYEVAEDDPDAVDATVRTRIVAELDPALESAGFEKLAPWEF